MRTDLMKRFTTLALAATLLVVLGAGSEAAAARQKQYDRGTAPRPRPSAGPTSGEPDQTGSNGAPAPPKMGQTVQIRAVTGTGQITLQQWLSAWGRIYLKRS